MYDNINTVWTEAQHNAIRDIANIMDITIDKAQEMARELFARRYDN
jgi:hypothetical protein